MITREATVQTSTLLFRLDRAGNLTIFDLDHGHYLAVASEEARHAIEALAKEYANAQHLHPTR
jgi:hypothetical protein